MASWHGLYSYVADRAAAAGGREGKTHEVQGKQDIKKFYSKEEGFFMISGDYVTPGSQAGLRHTLLLTWLF